MHADGALMGFMLPFLETDIFFKRNIHSISVSGHKFLGTPFPCGIFMMEKRFLDIISKNIEYIGTADNTISGSRNGHSAVFLDYILKQKGKNGLRDDILNCIDTSEYALTKLNCIQHRAWRNSNSITVVFDRPAESIVTKWQLAVQKNVAHIITMPHVTKIKIDHFVNDMTRHNKTTGLKKNFQ